MFRYTAEEMSDELDKIRKESGWKPRKRGKSQVTMDLLLIGSYTKFSCSLIKWNTYGSCFKKVQYGTVKKRWRNRWKPAKFLPYLAKINNLESSETNNIFFHEISHIFSFDTVFIFNIFKKCQVQILGFFCWKKSLS